MTELLFWIDPGALPKSIQALMEQIGPSLVRGLTNKELGARFGKSEDWAQSRVRLLRRAIAEHVLETAGNDLDPELRARLERYIA